MELLDLVLIQMNKSDTAALASLSKYERRYLAGVLSCNEMRRATSRDWNSILNAVSGKTMRGTPSEIRKQVIDALSQ